MESSEQFKIGHYYGTKPSQINYVIKIIDIQDGRVRFTVVKDPLGVWMGRNEGNFSLDQMAPYFMELKGYGTPLYNAVNSDI